METGDIPAPGPASRAERKVWRRGLWILASHRAPSGRPQRLVSQRAPSLSPQELPGQGLDSQGPTCPRPTAYGAKQVMLIFLAPRKHLPLEAPLLLMEAAHTHTHTHTVNATGNRRLGRTSTLSSKAATPTPSRPSAQPPEGPPSPSSLTLEPEPERHEVTQDLDNPLGPAAHPAR